MDGSVVCVVCDCLSSLWTEVRGTAKGLAAEEKTPRCLVVVGDAVDVYDGVSEIRCWGFNFDGL